MGVYEFQIDFVHNGTLIDARKTVLNLVSKKNMKIASFFFS